MTKNIIVHQKELIRGPNEPAYLGRLILLTPAFAERLKTLTEGIEVDLDAPIEGDVDL